LPTNPSPPPAGLPDSYISNLSVYKVVYPYEQKGDFVFQMLKTFVPHGPPPKKNLKVTTNTEYTDITPEDKRLKINGLARGTSYKQGYFKRFCLF
jgi:hypothetical protein